MSQEQAQTKQQGDNRQLLEAILENTQMGEKALDQLIPLAEEGLFRAELERQRNIYHRMVSEAELCLTAGGGQPRGQSALAQLSTRLGIRMKTLADHSTRSLAQMLSEGSYQGVLDCRKCAADFPEATIGAKNLLHELSTFQQESCRRLEAYL